MKIIQLLQLVYGIIDDENIHRECFDNNEYQEEMSTKMLFHYQLYMH